MAEWRSDYKFALIGAGVAVLTAIAQIFSDYMRKHPYYAWIAGAIAVLMIAAPLVHTLFMWLKRRSGPHGPQSPLEIIFEPLNPARRFWSMESYFDDYKRLIGTFWEHRVEIKNSSSRTLRNVIVTVEHIGEVPVKPYRAPFVRTKAEYCDLQPGCSELVLVHRWPVHKMQIGTLSGPSAWAYGPMKVTASADDYPPTEAVFDINYETDQTLFERGKY